MDEPSDNIGVDAAEPIDPTTGDDEPTTRAARVVARLGDRYWRKSYGGLDAFACLVRTVLSQNTTDAASQAAYDALLDRYGSPAATDPDDTIDEAATDTDDADHTTEDTDHDLARPLAAASRSELAATISSAGLSDQKSRRLIDAAATVCEEFGGAAGFDEFVRTAPTEAVRDRLLAMRGVGPKTADCVLLFAGGRDGVFPVDTHVHRVARRIGLAPPDADHETVRAVLERDVPAERCGFGHTATIQFGRDVCTARSPACLDDPAACPLADCCDRVGVSPETGTVVDPSDAD